MPKVSKKTRQIVGIVSLAFAVAIVCTSYLLWWNQSMDLFNNFLLVATLVGIVPIAILDYMNQSWRRAINDRLPQLVRDLSESQETGLTIIRALEDASKRKYGNLSDEVKKLTVQMSWGLSFEKALEKFADRIGTSFVRRFCVLVLEASRSGGRIRKVFSMTADFMEEMLELERKRASQMRPYIIIIYAAFFVFLFTTIVLVTSFFIPLGEFPMAGITFRMGAPSFKNLFFHMMLIQGLLGGLVAGKMGEGRVLSGLKHCIVMLIIGYVAYRIMMP